MQSKIGYLITLLLFCSIGSFAQQNSAEEFIEQVESSVEFEYSENTGPTPLDIYLQEDLPQKLFDKAAWSEVTEGIDYDEQMRIDRYDEDFSDDPNATKTNKPLSQGGSQSAMSSFVSFLLKSLLVIGIVALVAFIAFTIPFCGQSTS